MELSYEFEQDEREGPQTSRRDYTSTYSEELDIQTRGWAYHPALLTYTLKFNPEWEQIRDTNSDVQETQSFLSDYYASLEFLKYKPYSLILSGRRDTSTIRSSFAERTRSTADTYDAVFSLRYPILPVTVAYTHLEASQTGFYESDSDLDQVDLTIRHSKYLGETRLKGTYKDLSSTVDNVLKETYYLSAELNNTVDLDKNRNVTLNSDAAYEESDSTDLLIRRYFIYEDLTARHSDSLESSYTVNYEKDNRNDKLLKEDFRSEAKSAAFGLNHQLYENLNTRLNLSSSENTDKVRRNTYYRGSIDWAYRRDIPWGILRSNLGYGYTIRDQAVTDSQHATVRVFDEPVSVGTFSPGELANEDVVTSSVIVRDKASTDIGPVITFVEGEDYILERVGRITRIIRKVGSPRFTVDPQTVFVEYRYVPNPAFDYELFNQRYGVAVELWHVLILYYNLVRVSQDLLDGVPPETLVNDTIHAAGGEYRWKWSKTTLDWEDVYSTHNPTEHWTARELLSFRPGEANFLQISATYGQSRFKETGDEDTYRALAAAFQRQLTPQSTLKLEGSVLETTGQSQDSTDTRLMAEYNKYYRIWELTLRYVFRNERDNDIDQVFRNHYFLFELKRSLF